MEMLPDTPGTEAAPYSDLRVKSETVSGLQVETSENESIQKQKGLLLFFFLFVFCRDAPPSPPETVLLAGNKGGETEQFTKVEGSGLRWFSLPTFHSEKPQKCSLRVCV